MRAAHDFPENTHDFVHLHIASEMPAMTCFAKRLTGGRGDHKDLVQETILRALNASSHFRPGTALKSWLFTIMKNAFCTRCQKSKREPVSVNESLLKRLSIAAPQEWSIRNWEMRQALAELPQESRRSLLLVAFGTSYDDAARLCNCEIGTIKSRVSRARRQLSDQLDGPALN